MRIQRRAVTVAVVKKASKSLRIAAAAIGFCAGATAAFAASKVDARIFAGKAELEKASFLVVLRDQAELSGADSIADPTDRVRFVYESLRAQAELSQAALRARLDADRVPYRSYFLVNMIEVEGDRRLAAALAARLEVSSVAPNSPFTPSPAPREPEALTAEARILAATTVEPNVAKIGAPDVWARGFTGQGIVIGMADTGVVWDHAALKTHYRGFDGVNVSHDYNWHDSVHDARATNPCGSSASAPCDDDGHGTSTAGLAVGDDGAGNQVGVAPGAKFIACRNMDQGDGTPARYTECFQFFLAPTDHNGANPRPDLAAHIISNSWGCPDTEGCTDPNVLRAVVENVRAAGIFVAVAASNDGPGCATVDIPGLYEASFSVGATTLADGIASFSSRGPITADGSNRLKPDLCAPGVGLRVANKNGGYVGGFSGTSGSTPEVAGAVALLWSAAPALKGQVTSTADLLEATAVPLTSTQDCPPFPGSAVPNAVFGFGRLDIASAVALASPAARATPSAPHRGHSPRVVPPR